MLFNSSVSIASPNTIPSAVSTTKSPYQLYSGERTMDETRSHVKMEVTNLDRQILIAVNTTLLSHSALLEVQLKKMFGIEVNKTQLQRRIHHLVGAGYLIGSRIYSADGSRSATLLLRIGWRGAGLLKTLPHVFPAKQGYLASISDDPTKVKQILATAQLVVRTDIPFEQVTFCQTIVAEGVRRDSKKAVPIVRPQAIIQTESKTVLVEAVRRTDAWKEDLQDKLKRLNLCSKANDLNVEMKNPVLILLAESAEHQREVMQLLSETHYSFKIVYSNDVAVYETPSNCFYALPAKKSFLEKLLAG